MSETSPLCFGQLSIWRSIETNPLVDGVRSQLTSVHPLPTGVSEARVRAAVETLWRRHESLRTTFAGTGRDVRQLVHPRPADVLEVRSLATAGEVAPCAAELFARPFTLTSEFGWRLRLMTVADGTRAVALSVHHILADGWASRLLLAELDRLLTDPTDLGSTAPAPAELATRQRSDRWAARRSSAREHWTRLTKDFPGPAEAPPTPGQRIRCALELTPVSDAVADLADRHHLTTQSVVLALFALAVTATTGHERLPVHLMVANRLRPEWHDLVTSMNQIVPAGIVVERTDPVGDFLRHVQTAGLIAMRNGCHDVDEAAAITGRPPGSPVDYVVNYMLPAWPRGSTPAARQPVDTAPTVTPSTRPAIAGIYAILARTGPPVLELHVDTAVHPESRVRRMLTGIERALRLLSARPDVRVADLIALF